MDEEDDDLYGPAEPTTETQKEPKKEEEASSGDEPMDEGADSGDDDDDDSDSVGKRTHAKDSSTNKAPGSRVHYRQAGDSAEARSVSSTSARLPCSS